MSVLAIDIGNTRVGFNVFTAGKAQDPAVRLHHHELDKELAATLKSLWEKAGRETQKANDDDTDIVIASVARGADGAGGAFSAASIWMRWRLRLIGREVKVPLKTMLRDETTVGQDRLLGAMAAFVHVEAACAVVQVGSAAGGGLH